MLNYSNNNSSQLSSDKVNLEIEKQNLRVKGRRKKNGKFKSPC